MDAYLRKLHDRLGQSIADISDSEMRFHPPGKWCVGEILEHLYLSYIGTSKGFQRALQEGKPLATPVNWKHRAAALLVVRLGYMPGGRKAPPSAQPRGLSRDEVRSQILAAIGEMDDAITRAEAALGKGKLLDHPILGPLTAREWRKFHLVHGVHHVKQITKLRQNGAKS